MDNAKHQTTISKIESYVDLNLIPQLKEIEIFNLKNGEIGNVVDYIGRLERLSKIMKTFTDTAKKEINFNGKKVLRGETHQMERTVIVKTVISPAELQSKLPNADFVRCVTVNKSLLKPFLDKDTIKELSNNGIGIKTEKIAITKIS